MNINIPYLKLKRDWTKFVINYTGFCATLYLARMLDFKMSMNNAASLYPRL